MVALDDVRIREHRQEQLIEVIAIDRDGVWYVYIQQLNEAKDCRGGVRTSVGVGNRQAYFVVCRLLVWVVVDWVLYGAVRAAVSESPERTNDATQ